MNSGEIVDVILLCVCVTIVIDNDYCAVLNAQINRTNGIFILDTLPRSISISA